MELIVSAMRFIAPATAFVVLVICVGSLFFNRSKIQTLARLVDEEGMSLNRARRSRKNSQEEQHVFEIKHWETSIGSSNYNDIVINEEYINAFHAVISKKRRDWFISDTSAKRNSVFVNGQIINKKQPLQNGDIIQIGSRLLRFECDNAFTAETRQAIIQQAITPEYSQQTVYAVLINTSTNRPIYLKQENVRIGRSMDCEIVLNDPTVSSYHATIHRIKRGWVLTDLDSKNGTKLNGQYIYEPLLIIDGDLISFGNDLFIFHEQ